MLRRQRREDYLVGAVLSGAATLLLGAIALLSRNDSGAALAALAPTPFLVIFTLRLALDSRSRRASA